MLLTLTFLIITKLSCFATLVVLQYRDGVVRVCSAPDICRSGEVENLNTYVTLRLCVSNARRKSPPSLSTKISAKVRTAV